jgi:hypothetical protein
MSDFFDVLFVSVDFYAVHMYLYDLCMILDSCSNNNFRPKGGRAQEKKDRVDLCSRMMRHRRNGVPPVITNCDNTISHGFSYIQIDGGERRRSGTREAACSRTARTIQVIYNV